MPSSRRDPREAPAYWPIAASATAELAFDDNVESAFPGDFLEPPATDSFAAKMDFRVELPVYRGPLDLLLYLVRKHELEITEIPISHITEQYFEYLQILEQLDVDSVGDFIEVASLLIEIKSRTVLPQEEPQEDAEEPVADDPRDELVRRLLEYKEYKDAASMLQESGQEWQQRFPRIANDLPPRTVDPAEQPLHETELWDLVSAMGRIMRERERLKPVTNIVYDDTPIQVYMQSIHQRLMKRETVMFSSMFEEGIHKSKMIGVFLAILELTRNYGVVVEQSDVHGEMALSPGSEFRPQWDLSESFSDFDEEQEEEEAEATRSKPR